MFNKEFYPTPNELISKMISTIDFNMVNSILEPSAGKGDIVDALYKKWETIDHCGRKKIDIDTIEIDETLVKILKGKGYRVVHNDFLTYQTFKKYDLIIMNPPFSNGARHLLKAIEMQKEGGSIICILNAETLKNPYSNERKMLVQKLGDLDAKIEYIDNAFSHAERKTNVEVALIKIYIPEKEKKSYFFEQLEAQEHFKKIYEGSEYQVITDNFIEEIVRQYKIETNAGINLINEYNAMRPHILKNFDEKTSYNYPILKLVIDDREKQLTVNDYVCMTRKKYWKALFDNPKFTQKMTTDLIKEYYNRLEELENYDFSIYNIYQIQKEMSKNLIKGVEETIIRLFDELSYQHSYYDGLSKNIHYYNGWKTNKSWYINKKVIIPNMNAFSEWDGRFQPTSQVYSKLQDIEKTLNYLDGNRTIDIDMDTTLRIAEKEGNTSKIQLKYFKVTFYRKGTCHLEFTNLELLKKFNIYGSQRKGWLPPSYCKKTYEEMESEERMVIDDFEGKESYQETFRNKDYYIVDNKKLLEIGVLQ